MQSIQKNGILLLILVSLIMAIHSPSERIPLGMSEVPLQGVYLLLDFRQVPQEILGFRQFN